VVAFLVTLKPDSTLNAEIKQDNQIYRIALSLDKFGDGNVLGAV